MHPLAAVDEAELGSLARAAARLLNSRQLLSSGQRPNPQRAGSGIEFLDRRDYNPGDHIRDVDWRASARSRRPQVRRYCDEACSDWSVLLDCSSSMALPGSGKWRLAVQSAAAMSYLLLHLGHRVSVLVFDDRVEHMLPPGRGYSHYAAILRGLRRITPAQDGKGSALRCCVSRVRRNSPVFVISDFLAVDGMRDGLDRLALRSDRLHALQVLSSRDYALPPGRSARFRDMETGETMTLDLSAARRESYRQAVDAFEDSLSAYCRGKRIYYSRHADDETWKSALTQHLKRSGNLR